jgi:hypothetical protein
MPLAPSGVPNCLYTGLPAMNAEQSTVVKTRKPMWEYSTPLQSCRPGTSSRSRGLGDFFQPTLVRN